MRKLLLSTTVLLALAALVPSVAGTEIAAKEFACPVCATKFTASVLVAAEKGGGTDSDFCEWPKGTPGLQYDVQACPSCFYAAYNDAFAQPLAEPTVKALKDGLTKWKAAHPELAKAEDLSPGRRWELAAVCLALRRAPALMVGNTWLRASWVTRQCAGTAFKVDFSDPLSDIETLDAMDSGVKKEKDPARQLEALFPVAWGAHRAGDVKRRDATMKRLEGEKLDEAQTAKLAVLRKTFEQEKACQERAVACFRMAIEKEEPAAQDRHVYLYLAADLTRRMGKSAEALKGYREVKAAGKIRRDIANLCDFFINYLSAE